MKSKGKKRLSKALAIFMTVFMLMGMMPQAAFANEVPADDNAIKQEQQLDNENQNLDEPLEEDLEEQPELDMSNVPALASEVESDPVSRTSQGYVYISVSYNGKYIEDKDGGHIAYVPVQLSDVAAIELDAYNLSDYWYDEDGDGTYEITALQLIIYAHEKLYGGSWDDVRFTGSPGSSYFEGGVFGFSENLNYYLNGEYPLASAGWGATSDQIVLEAGDYIDMASFSSWSFFSDPNSGFHFFADSEKTFTHDYSAEVGKETSVKLVRSYSGMGSGATVYDEPGYTVSYGTSLYDAIGTVTTDDSGYASITFTSAGTWYVWADGGYGSENPEAIVSAPAFATVVVKKQPDLKVTLDLADLAEPIYDGGIVNYTLDNLSDFAYIDDTAEAGENCEYVFSAEDYDKYILYVDFYTEGDIVGWSINGKNYFAEDPGDGYLDWELSDNVYAGYGFNYKDEENNKEYIEFYLQLGSDENPYNTPGEWVIKPLVLTEEIVETFIAIDEIFADEITLESGDAIAYAWKLYNALSDTDKEIADYIFDVKTLLEEAQAEYDQLKQEAANQAAAEDVIAKINEIGTVSLNSESAINTARTAYDALTDEQKALVTNSAVLAEAEASLALLKQEAADQSLADAVIGYINEIGTVSLNSEPAINTARTAYDALTDEQKELVTNHDVLTLAETTLLQLKADQVVANAIMTRIGEIGTVTLESESTIVEIRAAYEELTDAQKELVTNYNSLTEAETALARLKEAADQAAADDVEEIIKAIGTVNIHSGKKVSEARKAFDELTETQQEMVENVTTLTTAESTLSELYKAAAKVDHEKIYDETNTYISGLGTPIVGSTGGEWMVIDITRAGGKCPDGYYKNVVNYVKAKINDSEQLHNSKSTDNSRVILGLTSAGYDVTDVAGYNLLMGLTDMTYIKRQGINGPIWALIAFDSHDYKIPVNLKAKEQASRDKLVDYILSKQLDNGGWALSGSGYDPDITGMAIQALAPYYDSSSKVKAAVDEALNTLSKIQNSNGGFSASKDGTCSESCAQVIVALTALGIDPETDPRFVKNGMSVVDAMCLFAVDGGGFVHVPGGVLDGMATEQSQYALAAYYRFKEGKSSLYDMSDVTIVKNNPDTGASGESGTGDAGSSNTDKNQQSSSDKTTTKSVTKSASIKLSDNAPTEEQLAQGKENHYCEETGVDARGNSNDILPWYIKLNVVKQEITDEQNAAVSEALGGEGEIFMLKDIHFINTKDGSEWQPTKPIKIKLPMVDIGDYEHAVIVHITDDGKIELIKGTVKGDMIEFEADSFSLYGIAGSNASIDDLLGVEDDDPVIWPWIVIAIIALAAIAYLAYRRKREA